ncbi:MAG: hypothetical protein VX498_05890 [Myxococcota bacterium]|nr:hypothetical protein [Myxococcota bacterium]
MTRKVLLSLVVCAGFCLLAAGSSENTTKPSGANQTGIDASDDVCAQLRRDLEKGIDETLRDMRAQGVDSSLLPSRAELKAQFEGPLRANGCKGF